MLFHEVNGRLMSWLNLGRISYYANQLHVLNLPKPSTAEYKKHFGRVLFMMDERPPYLASFHGSEMIESEIL